MQTIRRWTFLSWSAGIALAGCSSSSASDTELNHFAGAEWLVTGTESTACGSDPAQSDSFTVPLALANNGSGVYYRSSAGCLFEFSVSGDTATLSNAPVTCGTATLPTGDAADITFLTFTMTTSDGEHLTFAQTATVGSGGTTCMATLTGTGKR